jgi:pSer/pThr/pTyr-binding forkhead associated (FHA) protein
MPPRLIALDDPHTLLLDKPILLIGRHEECDIQLESRKVSRRHCCLAQVEDHLVVRDLESTNGIRINGKTVTEGRLEDGDELTIGNVRFRVSLKDDAAAVPPKSGRRPVKPTDRPQPAQPAPDNMMSLDIPIPLPEPAERANGVEPKKTAPPSHMGPLPPPDPAQQLLKRTEKQEILGDVSSEKNLSDDRRSDG